MGWAAGDRAADQADAAKDRRDRGATRRAALVFDGLGNHSMVNGDTRRAAEADAVIAFRKKWRGDFNVASVPAPHCVAISTTRYKTRRRTFTQAFTSMGDTADEASQNSLDYCNREKGWRHLPDA
jgi:hypothetical protein